MKNGSNRKFHGKWKEKYFGGKILPKNRWYIVLDRKQLAAAAKNIIKINWWIKLWWESSSIKKIQKETFPGSKKWEKKLTNVSNDWKGNEYYESDQVGPSV